MSLPDTASPVEGQIELMTGLAPTASKETPTTARPLEGVRVVEAASYITGPFAAQALADLGAAVLKVEPPTGDPYFRFGPQDAIGGVMFRAINHDKERRTLDLKLEHDRAEFYGLLDSADILISNWRPGIAVAFGLEPDVVRQRWPRLVWVRMSGYGQDGPLAHEAAFDAIIQARTGTMFAGEEMSLPPMYLADKVTAMMAVQAALAAMLQRSRTGRGSVVDVAMLDSLAYFNGPDILAGHQRIGRHDDRVGRQLRASRPLTTSDGALMLCPVSGVQLKRTLAAVGLEHQAAELKSAPDTTTMMERLYELMEARLREGTTAEQVEALRAADVPVTAVMSVDEHFHDPQILHNETYRTVDDPHLGPTRVLQYPARFDADAAGCKD